MATCSTRFSTANQSLDGNTQIFCPETPPRNLHGSQRTFLVEKVPHHGHHYKVIKDRNEEKTAHFLNLRSKHWFSMGNFVNEEFSYAKG